MRDLLIDHSRQHFRFYLALLAAVAIWLVAGRMAPDLDLVLAGDGFFACYLLGMIQLAITATPDSLRRRAGIEDEGILLIAAITLAAICFSLASLFLLLAEPGATDPLRLALAVAAVPLGWAVLHMIAAFHYAHRWYVGSRQAGDRRQAGGLTFAGTPEPCSADFLYHSFTIGMTAQVSDIQITSQAMRRLVLAHGLASFVFNTVLLALAVNVLLGVSGR